MGQLNKTTEEINNILEGVFDSDIKAKDFNADVVEAPSVAPSLAISLSDGVLTGNYSYLVTFYTEEAETDSYLVSAQVSPTAKKIELTGIPVSVSTAVIGRRIYRNFAGQDLVTKFLVVEIPDNTTTSYVDNVADANLGVAVPRLNTTGGNVKINNERVLSAARGTTVFGLLAHPSNTGYANTALGNNVLNALTHGYRNSGIGTHSLAYLTTGYNNTAVGVHSMNYAQTSHDNVAFGYTALMKSTGINNCAFGSGALVEATTADNNCAIGYLAMRDVRTGGLNIAIGSSTARSMYSGSQNVAIGTTALFSNSAGVGNVAIGHQAGYFETGSNKLFIDNRLRINETDGRLKSLIFGVFDASVENQQLTFNAAKINMASLPTSSVGLDTGDLWNDSGILKIA